MTQQGSTGCQQEDRNAESKDQFGVHTAGFVGYDEGSGGNVTGSLKRRKTEDRRRKTEVGRLKTEDRRPS